MNTIPTQDQTLALATAVRSNALNREQRDQVAVVLGMIGSAMRVAAQAAEPHSGAAEGGTLGRLEYARLLGATG